MREPFALANYLSRWIPTVRHDLASSDSETTRLTDLLDLAGPDDRDRWHGLGFGYLDPRGAAWLRAAVAARHGGLGTDDVLCCAGAQEALACVTAALLTPADHAVVVLPIYQPSEEAVTARCAASGVPLREEAGGWRLDVAEVAAALRPETRLVLMNMPNSPTGAALDPETAADLVALCRRRGLWLVGDEVYRHTPARGGTPPVADLYERGVSIDSLSKGFGLAGLRVGWIACRDRSLLAAALNAKNRMSSCLSAASEVLAHMALRADDRIPARSRAIGEGNRARLDALVLRHPDRFEPGPSDTLAFAFPRYRGPEGAERFAHDLARRADILVLPSSLWRSRLGPVPTDRLRIGLGRLGAPAALDALDADLHATAPRRAMAG
ncbi:hypothetical protein HNR00_004849 [Methylorubrum rhodinum]|uniref:Aminotransferase n=2 Tax=Methylorubrum rhodinum TaxID=29428 RepID=A0A840ZR67_9HYPH|nr:pyridoxal phosphate-dependent aminotransferase [Methylorubrum rhodinum]MBB5760106.1 hypothetical protein [Methylorubrum rhodinum]